MKTSFNGLIKELRMLSVQFDPHSETLKKNIFKAFKHIELPATKALIEYVDLMMFLIAHPTDAEIVKLAEKELKRVAVFIKKWPTEKLDILYNSGLPHTAFGTQFSHDFCNWLRQQNCKISIESWDEGSVPLIEILKMTLPSVEREYTSTGSSNEELLDALLVKKEQRFDFILSQINTLDDKPMVKDHLFDSLALTQVVNPKTSDFSRPYNRLRVDQVFFHDTILKKFDHHELLNRALPEARMMNVSERKTVSDVIRNSMALLARETDPATYIDLESLQMFDLERGISIAVFGMQANRQLPLESYMGFTLFKNGFPMSYGGAWLFGRRALFGMNIFEAFRGGESGYVMCQLLRTYRKAYDVDYFEVEPYQYGADNPDGIKSGAFWFYYRYGFKLLDKHLAELAEDEFKKIKTKSGYRSSEKTLLRFTESNIALNLGNGIPPSVSAFVLKITAMIRAEFAGNRAYAEAELISVFKSKVRLPSELTSAQMSSLKEMAFLAKVLDPDKKQIALMAEMVMVKTADVNKYQRLLLELLSA